MRAWARPRSAPPRCAATSGPKPPAKPAAPAAAPAPAAAEKEQKDPKAKADGKKGDKGKAAEKKAAPRAPNALNEACEALVQAALAATGAKATPELEEKLRNAFTPTLNLLQNASYTRGFVSSGATLRPNVRLGSALDPQNTA
jgi:hypothetical protein